MTLAKQQTSTTLT